MAENLDPVVRLTVEGCGFDGEEWGSTSGTPGHMTVFPESGVHQRAIVEACRAYAVEKLDYFIAVATTVRADLDFTLPNQPLRSEVESVKDALAKATDFAQVLVELAPWLYEDDDDEGEAEPAPDPEGSTRA